MTHFKVPPHGPVESYLPQKPSILGRQIRQARARANRECVEGNVANSKSRRAPTNAPRPGVPLETARSEWDAGFAQRGWKPFDYQNEAWKQYASGLSGMIVLPTGSGKTLTALGGPLIELRQEGTLAKQSRLRIIYISPLKALIRDVEENVRAFLNELDWEFDLETRTGDTSAAVRRQQRERMPHVLFTTPESLALLLTQAGWRERMVGVQAVVIDEWHELMGNKRGSLLELTLAKLRTAAPRSRTWAMSATLADEALAVNVACGIETLASPRIIVRSERARPMSIEAILPNDPHDLPWFGYGGLRRVPEVANLLDPSITTMIFTTTRGQAENWRAALAAHRPEWDKLLALHHGSLDHEERERVEAAVKTGSIPFVVATNSLDLGVDFPSVARVIQIGSVKGVARATQRGGRAFHRPGETTQLTICPTHFMEYIEVAALRRALAAGERESRLPKPKPLDVLIQFVLSSAFGEGFEPTALLREIQTAYSFRDVTEAEFDWVMKFVTTGGQTLRAYPEFQKLARSEDGRYRFKTPRLARFHLFNIGTIVGDSSVRVRFMRGGNLGQIDEGFVTKLKPGDVFRFAGKSLELVRMRDMDAYVRLAKSRETVATVFGGQSLPISAGLSAYMREVLGELAARVPDNAPPEIEALRSVLDIQRERSVIPVRNEILVERLETREGYHLFVYTLEGRAVNEGLGHLLAFRLSRLAPNTIAISANDHGFECLGTRPFPDDVALADALASDGELEHDLEHSLNFPEMAKRAFREIARVSGLIQQGMPGSRKSTRHLQMSSSLLFDVFQTYEPQHPLLQEAFREVKRTQLELPRLRAWMQSAPKVRILRPSRMTPFAFPLYLERVRSRLSTESMVDRIERLQKKVFAP